MSSLSLNRLCNGGGKDKNKRNSWNFGRSSTLPLKKQVPKTQSIDLDLNNNRPVPMMRQKHLLNRRGSLFRNQFKGVRKELIEKQASQIIHTMTVGSSREKQFDR